MNPTDQTTFEELKIWQELLLTIVGVQSGKLRSASYTKLPLLTETDNYLLKKLLICCHVQTELSLKTVGLLSIACFTDISRKYAPSGISITTDCLSIIKVHICSLNKYIKASKT